MNHGATVGRIPIIRVAGTHREVGRAIGAAVLPVIRAAVAFDSELPPGRSRDEQLALAARYREVTRAATGWLVEEIDGAAGAAGVDPLALFAASIEEIWTIRPSQATAGQPVSGRCSDLVVGPRLTADGHLWVAHNNDLSPETEDSIVAIEWRVPNEPTVFSIGSGPWISVGWNSAGLSLTGNELSPNDERVGVPRLLMVREQLTATSLEVAVAMALRPDRASSYNTVFGWPDGRVVNVEGSATDADVSGLDGRGTLAHTNHYVRERMLRHEGDPGYAEASAVRYRRAIEILAGAAPGSVDRAWLRAALADHATRPSICRHVAPDATDADAGWCGKSVFWCIADVAEGEIEYGLGNPCAAGPGQRYRFD